MLALAAAFAQTTSGSLSGSVVDAQGAAVVGAGVTVKNMETNATFSAKTDVSGKFVVANPQPARCAITVEQAGLQFNCHGGRPSCIITLEPARRPRCVQRRT